MSEHESMADNDEALALARENAEAAWVLTDRDVWHKNPFYTGPEQPHPEDDDAHQFIADKGIEAWRSRKNIDPKTAPIQIPYQAPDGVWGGGSYAPCLELTIEEDGTATLSADQRHSSQIADQRYSSQIQSAERTFDVHHGRNLPLLYRASLSVGSYAIPDSSKLHVLAEKLQPLVDRVRAGHEVAWDGNDMVGRLTTEDARDADEALDLLFDSDPDWQRDVEFWELDDWLGTQEIANATAIGDDLQGYWNAATQQIAEARENRVFLLYRGGEATQTDIAAWLKEKVDEVWQQSEAKAEDDMGDNMDPEEPQPPNLPPESGYVANGEMRRIEIEGIERTLWQIQTNRAHYRAGEGTLSGWIEDGVEFLQDANRSKIEDDAIILGKSQIGNVTLGHKSMVLDSTVKNYATVKGSDTGNAEIIRSTIDGARITGASRVVDSTLRDGAFNDSRLTRVVAPGQSEKRKEANPAAFERDPNAYWPVSSPQVTKSDLTDTLIESGTVSDSVVVRSTVRGDAYLSRLDVTDSRLGFGYYSPVVIPSDPQKEPTAPRREVRDLDLDQQKYALDPFDTIQRKTGEFTDIFYRAVLLRDIEARVPNSEEGREDVPTGTLPAGTRGAYVSSLTVIAHGGQAWAGPDVVIGGIAAVKNDAQVWGPSVISGGEMLDTAWAYGVNMDVLSTISGNSKVISSQMDHAHVSGESVIEACELKEGYLRNTVARDSILTEASTVDSEIIGSVVTGGTRNPISIAKSTVIASELSRETDRGLNLSGGVLDSRLERVISTGGSIYNRQINGDPVGGVTLGGHMTPRLAEAWTRSMMQEPADPVAGSWLSRTDIIDPVTLTGSREDIDRVRHFISVGVTAKNPDLVRYFGTLAARDKDYGVIEPILQDDTLREGLVTALRTMPGIVVNGRFEQSNMAVSVQEQVQALRARAAAYGATSDNPLRGVEIIDRIVSTEPVDVGIDGKVVPALPAITVTGRDEDNTPSYGVVFVLHNDDQAVSSASQLRIASFRPPYAPRFESRDEAIAHVREAADRSLDSGIEAAPDAAFRLPAPLLLDISPRKPDKAMLVLAPALPLPDGHSSASRLGVHDGFQAVIVDRERIKAGSYLFSHGSLDGALGSTTAAAAVADARAERGRGWTYTESGALREATMSLRTQDRERESHAAPTSRSSGPSLG